MPSPSTAPSYATVLRTRHACRTFGAALLGRLSYGMFNLSLVLAAREATGSYAVAGTVMALYGLTGVCLSPARAGLIDRYGPRRALPPMAAAFALLLIALAFATSRSGTSGVLLGVLAVTAGASVPPLGPVMRKLWSDLVPDKRLLQRAYSLDSVAEELLLVTGPLLVGLLITVTVPSAGLAVSAALVLTGSLLLVSSPAVRGSAGHGRSRAVAVPSQQPGPGAETVPGRRRALRADPGFRQAVAVSAAVGMGLGAFDLLVIAFADERHAPETVAWTLAALSAGSAIGGLAYGAVPWRASSRLRLPLLAAALGLSLAATGLAPHSYVLIACAALSGLFVAPALTTAYLIADESAGPAFRTRAGAWVNTAFNAGSSGATAATGFLVGRLPLSLCFALAAAPAVLSAATALKRPR
ncbi:MFS transporter [Streptomyces iconiensis]|uniref:MFS transporter n=1 Tax=Streptomyces iconiensis TaxID=1384038 RepID=A0ABT7A119_9ACTN|nr:MFS transporter [Streptomyces iconiensis]MDJ1134308.1 MFS transporter [Streptomyces iconiensis]